MKKNDDAVTGQASGLFIGSEPIDGVHDRRVTAKGDDDSKDTDTVDKGDDDSTDSDKSDKADTDTIDKGHRGDDSRDSDGKD